jgi:hypothetical protein
MPMSRSLRDNEALRPFWFGARSQYSYVFLVSALTDRVGLLPVMHFQDLKQAH